MRDNSARFPVWQIQSKAYACLLILLVHGNVDVDVCLRAKSLTELKKYLDDLKTLARSVEIVRNHTLVSLGALVGGLKNRQVRRPPYNSTANFSAVAMGSG